jgi:hypothetical protein
MSQNASQVSEFANALRAARFARGTSVVDAANFLLLSDKQIIGLESDDLSYFYTRAYAERAAISYAKLLDVDLSLDGAPPYERFKTPLSYKTVLLDQDIRKTSQFSRLSKTTISIGLTFIAIAFLASSFLSESTSIEQDNSDVRELDDAAIKQFDSGLESPKEVVVAQTAVVLEKDTADIGISSPVPIVTPEEIAPVQKEIVQNIQLSENVTELPEKSSRFFIVINRSTPVDVKDGRGRLLISGVQAPTKGKRVSGTPPFSIEVADQDAVEVYYLGSRIRPGRNDIDGIRMGSK